jgi:hypothetical protein
MRYICTKDIRRFEAYQSRSSEEEEEEERLFGGQVFVHGKDDPLGKRTFHYGPFLDQNIHQH